jgi:two-component system, OmpR family, heavy metal sensor histidine kinase CusS
MFLKPANRADFLRFFGTLSFRLTAGYSLAGLLLVFCATAGLYLALRAQLEKSNDLFLADKLHVVGTMLREQPDDWDGLHEEIELESAARTYQQFYIRLLDENGHPLLTTPGMAEQLDLSKLEELTRNHPGRNLSMRGKSGKGFRITSAVAQVGASPNRHDTIQIAIDVSQEESLLARFRTWFWVILSATFMLFPVAGYRIARQGIHPVEEMAATARRISSSNLRERIAAGGYPSELAALAGTFNQMLDRLEESFARISRFSADIAHELRTPVNNIRGESEVALARARSIEEYREVLESSLEETVRLSDLIADLLFLARAENPSTQLRREPVDLCELLLGICEYYEGPAADAQVALSVENHAQSVSVAVDRTLLQRAVGNLVSNALAHTPPGGSVVLASRVEDGFIRIDVSDTGVGIPPEALAKVFDRFYRVDPSRSQASGGTGLGLAIVKSIVALHGGYIDIASQLGHGTQATLRIPALPAGREASPAEKDGGDAVPV